VATSTTATSTRQQQRWQRHNGNTTTQPVPRGTGNQPEKQHVRSYHNNNNRNRSRNILSDQDGLLLSNQPNQQPAPDRGPTTQQRDETLTNQATIDQQHNPITFCPECDEGHQATIVLDGITKCPHCGTDCCATELRATRIESDGQQVVLGLFFTVQAARQTINDTLATEWGDATMVLQSEPQPNGRWIDSNDEEWIIEEN
jgi:hypothetical protein